MSIVLWIERLMERATCCQRPGGMEHFTHEFEGSVVRAIVYEDYK